jgi:hypothetical protein
MVRLKRAGYNWVTFAHCILESKNFLLQKLDAYGVKVYGKGN